MKRSVGLLLATLAAVSAAPAAAAPSKTTTIAAALGNLRWGMNERDVKTALRSRIKDKSAMQALDQSYAEFGPGASSWDRKPVSEEYTHGNDEAMLSYKDSDGSENYYLFIGGQLWKWVKYMPASAFGGGDFAKFSDKIEGRFGKGFTKDAEVNPGSGKRYKVIEYLDRTTRLRAVDKTKGQGQFALVFEAMDTVRSLASLRANTPVRKKAATEVAADDSDEHSAPAKAQTARGSQSQPQSQSTFTLASAAKNKGKSLFNDGNKGDDGSSYQAKKERVQSEAREKQRRSYERKEESKKGKELDGLAGVEDDDPIGGMK